jgi:hypothetical protein
MHPGMLPRTNIGIKNKGQSVILFQEYTYPWAQKKPTFAGRFVVVGWALNYGRQYPNCHKGECRQDGAQNIFNHINGVSR